MALKTVRLYWHAYGDYFFRPERAGVPRSCMSLKRGDLTLVEFHAATTNDFTVNSDGTVPEAKRFALTEYTGTPVAVIKTEDRFAADGDFEEAWNGFYSSNLSAGKFQIAVSPSADFDPDTLHRFAIQMRDADLNPLEPATIALDIGRNLYIGNEANAPVGITQPLAGNATITAGNSTVTVTIPNLTASGLVIISLLGTSAAFTTLAATCATNTLTIQSASAAPAGGTFDVAYRVVRL